ncbi:MAG: DUF1559 domain-containing protein [Pirellulales bacterium]
MGRRRLILTIILALAPVLPYDANRAAGQELQNRRIIPNLDPRAIAFARLDLTKIDPDALEKAIEAQLAEANPQPFAHHLWRRSSRNLAERLRRLKKLQVAEVYLVLTLHGLEAQMDRLMREPEQFIYAVVPVHNAAERDEIAKVVVEDPPGSGKSRKSKSAAGTSLFSPASVATVESPWFALRFEHATHIDEPTAGTLVVAGRQSLLDHLVKTERQARASVNGALSAAGEGSFQLVVAPPPVFARAVREILGPVKIDELSVGDTLAEGFQWGALGVGGQGGSRVVIQSRSADGAKQMERLIQLSLSALAKQPKAQDWQPADLAGLIDLEIAGDRLRWSTEKSRTPRTKLVEALRTALLAQQVRFATHQSTDQMKEIVLAFLNTHDAYKAFPTPANYDAQGKPLLSWRVSILQFMGEFELYREFRRDEPWDSPHNKKLIERMPAIYRRPFAPANSVTTPYQMPIGEKTLFQPDDISKLRDVRDGVSKTIGVVEVDPQHEVIWTKPDDWEVDLNDPMKGLTHNPGNTFVAGFMDGKVRAIRKSIDKEVLRRLLQAADGLPVSLPDTFVE